MKIEDVTLLAGLGLIGAVFILFSKYKTARKELASTSHRALIVSRRLDELGPQANKLERRIYELEKAIQAKDLMYERLSAEDGDPLLGIASLVADHATRQFEYSARYLETKQRPARKEAERIRTLKEETREHIKRLKLMEYKYEYLLGLFPDLALYADDVESLRSLSEAISVTEAEAEADRTRNYLSPEEYQKLPERKRNQLALDRYIRGKKSTWQIGRDYELFVGHLYKQEGWEVQYTGIEHRLMDMGRDLVAKNGAEIHVVQCKYWSRDKVIHEKHICQLYGTAVQYQLANGVEAVTPVFYTNIELSRTAQEFAEHLGVLVFREELGDFPRIKCNINRGADGERVKIYHLPMDQQYDSTKIDKPGEFFAFKVKDAERSGFRRALRWRGSK